MTSRAEAEEIVTRLAREGSDEARARLVEALGVVGRTPQALAAPPAQAAVSELMATLLSHAGPEQRARLAEVLAPEAWLPEAVARDLADGALAAPDSAALLTGLAANPSLGEALLLRLAEAAERLPWVRAPLARNPGLTPALATVLHAAAGADLRRELEARFPDLPLQPRDRARVAAADDGEILVRKLHGSGLLGPGRLLRFVREGRLDLFQVGVALLTRREADEVAEFCADPHGPAFERLCAEAGLDRALLPEIAAQMRALAPAVDSARLARG